MCPAFVKTPVGVYHTRRRLMCRASYNRPHTTSLCHVIVCKTPAYGAPLCIEHGQHCKPDLTSAGCPSRTAEVMTASTKTSQENGSDDLYYMYKLKSFGSVLVLCGDNKGKRSGWQCQFTLCAACHGSRGIWPQSPYNISKLFALAQTGTSYSNLCPAKVPAITSSHTTKTAESQHCAC